MQQQQTTAQASEATVHDGMDSTTRQPQSLVVPNVVWHIVSKARRHERVTTHRLYQMRFRRCQEEIDNQRNEIIHMQNEIDRVRASLRAARLERDVRRPGSPIASYLALHGVATIDQLTTEFGPDMARELVELLLVKEVICQPSGQWRWVHPADRQVDLTTTMDLTSRRQKDSIPTYRPPVLEGAH